MTGARPAGTTTRLEDVVVAVPALLGTCEVIGLFERHGYDDSAIFGHATDGNIHFTVNERLGGGDPDRLHAFTRTWSTRARPRRLAHAGGVAERLDLPHDLVELVAVLAAHVAGNQSRDITTPPR